MKPSKKEAVIDSFDKNVTRQTMEDFNTQQKIVPTLQKLLLAIIEKINFPWHRDVIRLMFYDMGFIQRSSVSKRKMLVE
jgi:hypothetical protein